MNDIAPAVKDPKDLYLAGDASVDGIVRGCELLGGSCDARSAHELANAASLAGATILPEVFRLSDLVRAPDHAVMPYCRV